MKRFFIFSILFLLLFTASCQIKDHTIQAKKGPLLTKLSQDSADMEAYPGIITPHPSIEDLSGYPEPIANPLLPIDQLPSIPTAVIPQPGKGSISGVLFSFTNHMLVPKTTYYLTLGWGEDKTEPPPGFSGPNSRNGDIIGISDEFGNISLDAIPPGTYYLAVESAMNWVAAVNSDLNPTLRPIIVEANKKVELGIIYLSWP